MSKYKYSVDKPSLSDDQILKHKDFSRLLTDFKTKSKEVRMHVKRPVFKLPVFWIGAAASIILAITFIIYFNQDNSLISLFNTKNKPSVTADTNKYYINPPLEDFQIAYETHVLNNRNAIELKMASSTLVKIPAQAFVDSLGNTVDENVTIQFREFHKPLEFFLSGIPMAYDSNGITYQFESAGMFEFRAFKDNQQLFLDKNKSVDIEIISYSEDDDFNLYHFDKEKGQWVYHNNDIAITKYVKKDREVKKNVTESDTGLNMAMKDKNLLIEPLIVGDTIIDAYADNDQINLVKPEKPERNSHIFQLDIDVKKYPELSMYENVLFAIDESERKFDTKLYSVTWEDVELRRSAIDNYYQLLLLKNDTTVVLKVKAVFDDQNYQKAVAQYNEQKRKIDKKQKDWEDMRATQVENQYIAMAEQSSGSSDMTNEFISYYNSNPSSRRRLSIFICK